MLLLVSRRRSGPAHEPGRMKKPPIGGAGNGVNIVWNWMEKNHPALYEVIQWGAVAFALAALIISIAAYTWEKIDYDDENKKSLREILEEAQATAKAAKDVADGAAKAIAAVQNTISVVPSQSGALTYNKGKQKPAWNNFATEMMTVTYGEDRTEAESFDGETEAGSYTAYFKPKESYTWGDKSTEEKAVTWTIQRATIATIPSVNGTLTYNESPQAPKWKNYNEEQLDKTEEQQTNAGDYSTTFTPKSNYQWSGGDITGKAVKWTIGRASLDAVPSQSGTLTYSGGDQSPEWNDYDEGKLTLGGVKSATDAGTYAATFAPTSNYQWSDGGTEERSVNWTIGKAAGSLSLDKDTITLDNATSFDTIKVTRAGDGAISASSSDDKVATAKVSGDTVLVTGVGNGSATITIKVAEGKNHKAPANKTCGVTVKASRIYGVSWDGNSGTKWTRTDDATLFTDPVPAVNNGNGSSPFDTLQPWAGMVKSNRTGGVMVAIPKFWYKLTQSGKSLKIQIADQKTDGFYVSPAHMDRGDGKGERDVIYVGRYHSATGTYKSETGKAQLCNVTRATARSNLQSVGTGYYMLDFATRFTEWLLYLVEFADWNSQKTIGYGCSASGSKENNGKTDGMAYHTGTTAKDRTTYGYTQYRNIEGLWDNVLDWTDGCYNNSNGLNIILNPSKYSDSANGTCIGKPSSGWPSAFTVSDKAGFPMFYASEANGNDNTYSCDGWNFSTSNACVYVGGSCNQGTHHGLFYVNYGTASYSSASIGARLQELP